MFARQCTHTTLVFSAGECEVCVQAVTSVPGHHSRFKANNSQSLQLRRSTQLTYWHISLSINAPIAMFTSRQSYIFCMACIQATKHFHHSLPYRIFLQLPTEVSTAVIDPKTTTVEHIHLREAQPWHFTLTPLKYIFL